MCKNENSCLPGCPPPVTKKKNSASALVIVSKKKKKKKCESLEHLSFLILHCFYVVFISFNVLNQTLCLSLS